MRQQGLYAALWNRQQQEGDALRQLEELADESLD